MRRTWPSQWAYTGIADKFLEISLFKKIKQVMHNAVARMEGGEFSRSRLESDKWK